MAKVTAALDVRLPPAADHVPLLFDHLAALLDDFSPAGIVESEAGWRVFFERDADRDAAGGAIRWALGARGVTTERVDVPDEDWARRSQAALGAVRVGHLVVAPPWDVPRGAMPLVVIEPSMAFGTGHHASTRLCLRALQGIDLRGRTVVDVGTGSGILAIAAVVLGAARAAGIDRDADAIACARENRRRNPGVAGRVALAVADISAIGRANAGVVVANLTGPSLCRHASGLAGLIAPGGSLVVSGLTADEEGAVTSAFSPLTVVWRERDEGWLVLVIRGEHALSAGGRAGREAP